MAKKKLVLALGRGVVVAGVGLSILRGDDAVAMDDLQVVQQGHKVQKRRRVFSLPPCIDAASGRIFN